MDKLKLAMNPIDTIEQYNELPKYMHPATDDPVVIKDLKNALLNTEGETYRAIFEFLGWWSDLDGAITTVQEMAGDVVYVEYHLSDNRHNIDMLEGGLEDLKNALK